MGGFCVTSLSTQLWLGAGTAQLPGLGHIWPCTVTGLSVPCRLLGEGGALWSPVGSARVSSNLLSRGSVWGAERPTAQCPALATSSSLLPACLHPVARGLLLAVLLLRPWHSRGAAVALCSLPMADSGCPQPQGASSLWPPDLASSRSPPARGHCHPSPLHDGLGASLRLGSYSGVGSGVCWGPGEVSGDFSLRC